MIKQSFWCNLEEKQTDFGHYTAAYTSTYRTYTHNVCHIGIFNSEHTHVLFRVYRQLLRFVVDSLSMQHISYWAVSYDTPARTQNSRYTIDGRVHTVLYIYRDKLSPINTEHNIARAAQSNLAKLRYNCPTWQQIINYEKIY